MSGSDFRKTHLATEGRVAEDTPQGTSWEWGAQWPAEGTGNVWLLWTAL